MAKVPTWLQEFANSVAAHLRPLDVLPPLGCHYCQAGRFWEVTLFAAATEVVGGTHCGKRLASRFTVDVLPVVDLLTEVSEIEWQTTPFSNADELGSHLSIKGTYRGKLVHVRILAKPPQRFRPGRRAKVYEHAFEDVW